MNMILCPPQLRRRACAAMSVVALLLGMASPAFAQPNDNGTVTGHVRSQTTNAPLRGASVTISGDERYFALTAEDGSFRINHVPAGDHTLIVNYTGLDTSKIPVSVVANESKDLTIAMSSAVYALEKFEVSAVRDGQAAAINEQKNAPNVVNIVATDAYGNVADTNPANLLIKLPGISPERDEAEAYQVSIRGIAANLNSVSVDGTLLASASTRDDTRGFELDKVSTNSIESIEVIKAPTPDNDADSIGGKINLRTKNGFDGTGRRIRYSIGTNAFLQRYMVANGGERHGGNGLLDFARAEAYPSASFNYSDVLGADKRWAITFNASFNRTFSPRSGVVLGYDNGTLDQPFPKYSEVTTREDDILLDRFGVGGKINFKLSANTMLYVSLMYNKFNDDMTQHKMKLQNIKLPGALQASPVQDIMARIHYELEARKRTVETGMVQVGGRTQWRDYDIDYDISTSKSYATDRRSAIQERVPDIGFRIDKTNDIRFPSIEITSGDPTDYSKGSLEWLDHQMYEMWDDVTAGKINVRRDFNTRFPTYLQTGVRYRGQEKTRDRRKDRFKYVGTKEHLNDYVDDGRRYYPVEGRYDHWIWPNLGLIDKDFDTQPELFLWDQKESIKSTLKDDFNAGERIYATYITGSVKTGGLTTLAGIRVERTETYGSGVQEDLLFDEGEPGRYGNVIDVKGGYTSTFPGLHLRYAATPNLIFRASYSTSIGRPNFTRLLPGIKVRELDEDDPEDGSNSGDPIPRIEVNNTHINPQFSGNFDADVEYYMKGIGSITVGVFRKNLSDFIFTSWDEVGSGPDNGYGGLYEGWARKTQKNGGWAVVNGLELSYQQQLSFLPSPFDGLGIYGNATFLNSHGTYDDVIVRDEIAGFTKRSANGGLSYIKYGITARVSVNFNGPRLQGYNADLARQFYDGERTSVDLSLAYALPRARTTLFVDINNITNSVRTRYKGRFDLQGDTQVYGMRVTAGIKGEF
jgi:TonB-dependent receptor